MDWIYENIRNKRKEKGLSQEVFGELLGMKQNSYSNLESGKTKNILKHLPDIAVQLETPVEDLLMPKGVNVQNNTNNTSSTMANVIINIDEKAIVLLQQWMEKLTSENKEMGIEIAHLKKTKE